MFHQNLSDNHSASPLPSTDFVVASLKDYNLHSQRCFHVLRAKKSLFVVITVSSEQLRILALVSLYTPSFPIKASGSVSQLEGVKLQSTPNNTSLLAAETKRFLLYVMSYTRPAARSTAPHHIFFCQPQPHTPTAEMTGSEYTYLLYASLVWFCRVEPLPFPFLK